MRTRLAMVACVGPHEGPKLRARGNETGIRIICLGEGESVTAKWLNGTAETHVKRYDAEGEYPLPQPRFSIIWFEKVGGIKPTTVELIVDG